MKFNYQARTKEGEVYTGQIEASSQEAAVILLQKGNLYVTFLEEAIAPIYAKKIKLFEKTSKQDLVLFSRQLSILFRSKVPLVESLRVLAVQIKSSDFKEKILSISEEVEGGMPLSKAISRYPKVFSLFYVAMVRSGELSGKLSESLNYLAEHLEKEYHLASKIKGAMIYPCLIIFVIILVLSLMIFFVVPQMTKILEADNSQLPFITKVVIGFSAFSRKWAWLMIVTIVGLIFASVRYYATEKGKNFFENIFFKMPVLGNFLRTMYLTRIAENLSTLVSGGLPIAQTLEIIGDIIGNSMYKKIILETENDVKKGEPISSVFSKHPNLFPPVFIQMVVIGEKTGTLDSALMNLVDFYQKETDRTIDNLLSIMEPLLIIFLGAVVGGIMFAILMPMYKMITL